MKPLVSIIIPAYNAEKTVAFTVQSALAQTWPRKEIIVVNDGSTDRTTKIVEGIAGNSKEVTLISTENQGLSAAINHAFAFCKGDYIQELDSDDVIAPDKIERQLAALRPSDSKRVLLSSPWAPFYHRTRKAHFVRTSLWYDLAPVEWLLRKMYENLHMQNATWLVSRELWEAAGPWDKTLHYDQDGEYYARVLIVSEGTRFVPEGRVYYRASGANSISYIGASNKKKDSLLVSMRLHIQYIRSLEDSDRVRKACLIYLQNWFDNFYPDRPDIVEKVQRMAAELGGHLEVPRLRWKYAWMKPLFGWKVAKLAQRSVPQLKASMLRNWDRAMFKMESRRTPESAAKTIATAAAN